MPELGKKKQGAGWQTDDWPELVHNCRSETGGQESQASALEPRLASGRLKLAGRDIMLERPARRQGEHHWVTSILLGSPGPT